MRVRSHRNTKYFFVVFWLSLAAIAALGWNYYDTESSQDLHQFAININPDPASPPISNLVSDPANTPTEQPTTPAFAPEQPIVSALTNLKLMGIAVSNLEQNSKAIIQVNDKQATYSAGAYLLPDQNLYLETIFANHVVINNNGIQEILYLEQPKSHDMTQDLPPVASVGKGVGSFHSGPPGGYDESMFYRPDEASEEKSLDEIRKVMPDFIAMTLKRDEGTKQIRGYAIAPGANTSSFHNSGLMENDIISAINGIPTTKPGDILNSLNNAGDSPIALELERGEYVIQLEIKR